MIKGDKDKLLDLAKNNVCSEHHLGLEVIWDDELRDNVLRCIEGHYPESITRTKVEAKKVFDKVSKPLNDKMWLVPKVDLGTGEVLAPEWVLGLIHYAQKYNLDPYRAHVVMMYSKPYITIDGYLYHANRTGVKYSLTSHPLSEAERKTYQIEEKDHAWIAAVKLLATEESFTGLGVVTHEEMIAKSKKDTTKLASPVVAAHPWQLSQKRAEWQALRRAFPIGDTEKIKEEVTE